MTNAYVLQHLVFKFFSPINSSIVSLTSYLSEQDNKTAKFQVQQEAAYQFPRLSADSTH